MSSKSDLNRNLMIISHWDDLKQLNRAVYPTTEKVNIVLTYLFELFIYSEMKTNLCFLTRKIELGFPLTLNIAILCKKLPRGNSQVVLLKGLLFYMAISL